MKTLHAICLTLCGLLLFAPYNDAANSNQPLIDSLTHKIERLEQTIAEGSYTRIPNQDFENIINNKIETSLRETVNWWLLIIAAVVSVVGFLVNRYAKQHLQTILDERAVALKSEMGNRIEEISQEYFSNVIETLIDFKTETISKNNFVVDTKTISELRKYIDNNNLHVSEDKKIMLIDTIMCCYYYTDFDDRTEKMIELIECYEKEFSLLASTYANAALAFMHMYQIYGTSDFMKSAVENCSRAINKAPDYGVAYAIKLELQVIALEKAYNEEGRQLHLTALERAFKEIENNNSVHLAHDIVSRLNNDRSSYLNPYVEQLYTQYPKEMEAIQARVPEAA